MHSLLEHDFCLLMHCKVFFLSIAKYNLLKKEIGFRLKLIFGTLFMKVLFF
jgi:hypothetical protein